MSSSDSAVPMVPSTSTWYRKHQQKTSTTTVSSSSSSTSTNNKNPSKSNSSSNSNNKSGTVYQQDQQDVLNLNPTRETEILNTIRISSVLPSLAIAKRKKEEAAKGRRACFEYGKGNCHYGDKCRFIHIDTYQNSYLPNATITTATPSTATLPSSSSSVTVLSSIPLPPVTLPSSSSSFSLSTFSIPTTEDDSTNNHHHHNKNNNTPSINTVPIDNTDISAHVLYEGLVTNGRNVLRQFANIRSEKLAQSTFVGMDSSSTQTKGNGTSTSTLSSSSTLLHEELADSLPALTTSFITPLTPIQRYYTPLYSPDAGNGEIIVPTSSSSSTPSSLTKIQATLSAGGTGNRGEDQYVYLQSNRTCIIGIAPSHPIVRYRIPVVKVHFAEQLRNLSVTGKRKRGGIFLEPNASICTITLQDGRSYILRACIRAALIEVNTRLETEPYLLNNPYLACTKGWLAIMTIKLDRIVDLQTSLLNETVYTELCGIRKLPSTPEEVLRWVPSTITEGSNPSLLNNE